MDVNFWAVIVAAVSSFLLGGLWYSPIARSRGLFIDGGYHTGYGLVLGAWH